MRPPTPPAARARRRLEALLRRNAGVMLVLGEWDGAPLRLRVTGQHWTGLGEGHGRLRACRAEVIAEGRGAAGRTRRQWLWLPAPDGTIADAESEETPPDPARRLHRDHAEETGIRGLPQWPGSAAASRPPRPPRPPPPRLAPERVPAAARRATTG